MRGRSQKGNNSGEKKITKKIPSKKRQDEASCLNVHDQNCKLHLRGTCHYIANCIGLWRPKFYKNKKNYYKGAW